MGESLVYENSLSVSARCEDANSVCPAYGSLLLFQELKDKCNHMPEFFLPICQRSAMTA